MGKGFLSIPPGNIMGIERDNWPEVGWFINYHGKCNCHRRLFVTLQIKQRLVCGHNQHNEKDRKKHLYLI